MASRITILLLLGLCFQLPAQVTTDTKDVQQAKQRLIIGTDNTKYLSQLVETINVASTHHQSPTAKAVWDLLQAYVVSITAGTGISVTGTPPNFTITNTGDTNASDDITTSTTAGGDLSGTYPNPLVDGLQNRPVSSSAPSSGDVLKWNGSAWAPATDAGGSGHVLMDEGSAVAQRDSLDFRQTANINVTLTDTGTKTKFEAVVRANSLTDFEIAPDAIGTSEIANASILGEDINDMGADPDDVLKWNGTTWAPGPPSGGSGHLIRADDSDQTQRAALNFLSTGTIEVFATDDAISNETELELSIPTGGVTSVEIASDAVGSAEIAANAVGTSEVADNTLTASDLNVNVLSSLDGVTNDGGDIDLVAGAGVSITPNDGANTITITNTGDTNASDDITGTISNTQVAYGSATNTIAGSANMTWTGTKLNILGSGSFSGKRIDSDASGTLWLYTASNGTFLGGAGNTTMSGPGNFAAGNGAFVANTTGQLCVAIGNNALNANTTGTQNFALGGDALKTNTTGTGNIAIGSAVLKLSNGNNNVGVGSNVLTSSTTGYENTGIGSQVNLNITTGYTNTTVGNAAGLALTSGYRNTSIGAEALTSNVSGFGNNTIGFESNYYVTGDKNIAIGYASNLVTTTGSSNIVIGNQVGPSSASASNELRIQSAIYGTAIDAIGTAKIGIGIANPDAKMQIKGTGTTSSTYSLIATNSTGTTATAALAVRDDNAVGINKNDPAEKLDVNGQGRFDAVDIRDWNTTDNTNTGEIHFETGGGTEYPYLTVGDGERRFPFSPKEIQLQAIDYNTNWGLGRTAAFWTVPARYNGWKIYSVTLMVSSIGTGTNTIETEKGGVAQATTTITQASHKVVLDAALATDDIWTWDVTAVGGTPTKGLFIEITLRHN